MMTTTTTSFCSSPFPFRSFSSSHSPIFYAPSHIKKGILDRELGLCCSNFQSEPETTSDSSSSSSTSTSSSNVVVDISNEESGGGISAYKLCASLGGIGFLETAYLTYLKLTGAEALCPTTGSSCNTILTSAYSSVFGVPLPLVGMLAYGVVTILGIKLGEKEAVNVDEIDGEMILIWTTTSMAAASAYFLYILSTEFAGESCLYCLASAVLSFTLFFIALKNFGSGKIQKMLGSQLVVVALVVGVLTASYNASQPVSSSFAETELPYVETEITTESSPLAISLAKHLHSIGAKLYGAFWCSHCLDQKEVMDFKFLEGSLLLFFVLLVSGFSLPEKVPLYSASLRGFGVTDESKIYCDKTFWTTLKIHFSAGHEMFGREAAKLLNYVECFPHGVKQGTKMADACYAIELKGFPTWEINGQVLSGEKQLSELAILSGMKLEDSIE